VVHKILNLLKRNKTILENFSYLGFLQIVNMLIPLATYPYLIRVLEKDTYGLIILSQGIISYLVVIINFGFNISATKDISIHRNNKMKLNEIVSIVLIIKFVLLIFASIILLACIYLIPQLKEQQTLLILCMWMCFYEFIFPVWYYQGIEKMKYITLLTLASRLIFLTFIFILIKSKEDYLILPMINGLGALIAGGISLYIIFVIHKIKFVVVPLKEIRIYLKEGFVLFLTNAVMVFKDKTNILLIGSFIGTGAVSEFDLAIKIKDLLLMPITLLNQAVYPKISKERNMKFMMRILKVLFISITILSLIIFPFIDEIILFLAGEELIHAAYLIRLMIISVPITTISFTLATNCINALGFYKLRLKSMMFTTLFYFALILTGYILEFTDEILFYAYIIIAGYLVELFYRLYLVNKYKMLQ
jgi:O-antigen/teichoic acid export membrane protein